MPVLDGGLFIILSGVGFGSLILSSKFGATFAIIGAVGFFALALFMFANYDVTFTTNYEDGTNAWNQTSYIIGSNADVEEVQQKLWMGWIFMMFGLTAIVLFFIQLLGIGKGNK